MTEEQILDRFARFYDDDYRNYDDDLALVIDLAQEFGGPILELGCGTGRLLLPLAELGLTVTGIDLSAALLAIADTKFQNAGLQGDVPLHLSLVEGDFRNFELAQKNFAFAYCVSNTLMHCTTQAEQIAALRATYDHLKPGGALLIDLFNPDVAHLQQVNGFCELADQWCDPQTGAQVYKWCTRSVDVAEQLQETLFIYEEIFDDGTVHRTPCPFTLRFLWRSELELMLEVVGFRVDALWGDFDGTSYSSASERLILLAIK